MYVPHAFAEQDTAQLVAFMRANSFATLVSVLEGAPFATHLPLVVRQADDGGVVIGGHVARANPQHTHFDRGEALAIFSGPHAYISPTLYEKRESVPTWNYIAVHAYGVPRAFSAATDPTALDRAMRELIATYEAAYQVQWDSLSATFRDGMLAGIVAFELQVTRLEGKYKLSQNRSAADHASVTQALLASDDHAAQATGAAMTEHAREV